MTSKDNSKPYHEEKNQSLVFVYPKHQRLCPSLGRLLSTNQRNQSRSGLAIIPLLTFSAQQILRLGNVPYITLTNFRQFSWKSQVPPILLLLIRLLLLLSFVLAICVSNSRHSKHSAGRTHLNLSPAGFSNDQKRPPLDAHNHYNFDCLFCLGFPFSYRSLKPVYWTNWQLPISSLISFWTAGILQIVVVLL